MRELVRFKDIKHPSLEGFARYAQLHALFEGNSYYWSSTEACAVALYLKEVGQFSHNWYENPTPLIILLDELSHGPWPVRDGCGQFASTKTVNPPQWTWRALLKRIRAVQDVINEAEADHEQDSNPRYPAGSRQALPYQAIRSAIGAPPPRRAAGTSHRDVSGKDPVAA